MIIGHGRQRAYLQKIRERGTAGHAYLFFGPAHVGKFMVAKEWMKLFFPKEDAARIDNENHPDVLCLSRYRPLVTENQKEIGIDDMREVRRRVSLRPQSGEFSFVIIDGANDLSEEAQNSFLKVLEEPPSYARFVLVTDSPERLLPTVVSRTVPLEFSFVSDEEIGNYLMKQDCSSEMQRKILAISSGRPGIAVRSCEDEGFFKNEQSAYESFCAAAGASLADQFIWSFRESQNEETVEKFIFFLLAGLRKDFLSDRGTGAAASAKEVLTMLDILKGTNVNRRLLLDTIFLSLGTASKPAL